MDEGLQSQIDEANRLLGERKYDEIVELVQPLLIRETEGQAQRVYGMAMVGLGRHQEAVHILMTAAQLLPNDVTVAFAYGTALNQNGQTEGARASFERALTIDANHPGAKMGYLNTSKVLADRDEPAEPMKAIEWLYGVWQRDINNAELANRIIDIYIRNGWSDSARQFAALLPPQLKNSEAIIGKLKSLPSEAPPVDPANVRPTAPTAQGPVFESCPFCKQQIMMGVHTCPHCKMIIRAKSMPGQDYKPSWQEVTLNVLCWIGIALSAFQVINVFVQQTQATGPGGYALVMNVVSIGVNIFILQRNDFVMSIAKWLYIIGFIISLGCGCMAMGLVGASYGRSRQAVTLSVVILMVEAAYQGFMAYLLNHEGDT